ncbi:ATP-dependent DNA ligase [Microbacteriaceae bacterium VKM Ac-2855]|nr:ATP-dependent DNA ligase [Microbacteriaceae bacterium VKM Ac-2855]
MGTLTYGNHGFEVAFDDRALLHLQIVITGKLRRRESFVFSWSNSHEVGSGRTAIWLDPSSTIIYHYFGSRSPSVNRAWLDVLTQSADAGSGLIFTPEPPLGATDVVTTRGRA